LTGAQEIKDSPVAEKTRKQQIEEMLAEDPNDTFLRYGLAMEYISAGADAEAVRCFKELLDLAPDYVAAYLQLAQAHIRMGQTQTAREVLTHGIAEAAKAGEQHAREEMQGFLAGLN
jgi:thioredoxin-like negative regulator of GroEL